MNKLSLSGEQPIAVNALRNMRARIASEIRMHSRKIDRRRVALGSVENHRELMTAAAR
jgi:predicted  nucleic acid-binding Zn-ribbon protein